MLAAVSAAEAQHAVTAVWDRNTDAATAGYRLSYGTASGQYQWSVDAGNQVTAALNLSPGVYYFAVSAYNASYQYGPPSSEVTFSVGGVDPPPTAAIQASLQAPGVALVAWQTTNASAVNINGVAVAASGSTTVPITATTTFTLTAVNPAGVTATASATVTVTTENPMPVPTVAIQASLQAPGVALVAWQTSNASAVNINGIAVAASGSETVPVTATTTFTLVAVNPAGQTATASATVTTQNPMPVPTVAIQASLQAPGVALVAWQTTNASAANINGVAVAASGSTTVPITATTTFTLTAVNPAGQTATASATVSISLPGPPATNRPGPPTNVTAAVSGTNVTLRWQPPTSGGPPTEYLLFVGTNSWGTNVVNGQVLGNVLTISANLPRGSYYARIRARNAAGTSHSSSQAFFRVGQKLATPGGFAASWQGDRATLQWVASAADSPDRVPSNYVLEAGTAPGLADVGTISLGTATSFAADVPQGVYYVRVRALNANGDSDPTREIVVTPAGTSPAPTGLIAGGSGPTVNLSWQSPGGGRIYGYVIEAGSEPGHADIATLFVNDVNQFTTQAPPGTYFVRVRAVNSRGAGLPSNEVVIQK